MKRRRISLQLAGLAFIAIIATCYAEKDNASQDQIPAAEFSRIIKSFSEEDGYFFSDNLISNEDGYLSVINKLRELRVSGGAYIGVGPEQNFTYIAKLRPAIAFLIDIRRKAMLQHLMHKALFRSSHSFSTGCPLPNTAFLCRASGIAKPASIPYFIGIFGNFSLLCAASMNIVALKFSKSEQNCSWRTYWPHCKPSKP